MRVEDLMLQGVRALPASMKRVRAAEIVAEVGVPAVVVWKRRAVGVVSAGDLADGVVSDQRAVGELVYRSVVTIGSHATLSDAAALLCGSSTGSIPVMDEGEVVGVLAPWVLLDRLARVVGRTSGQPSSP